MLRIKRECSMLGLVHTIMVNLKHPYTMSERISGSTILDNDCTT
jgi:hypothetical protein